MSQSLGILVIEDYDALREAVVEVLSRDGHRVIGVPMAEDVDDEPLGFLPDLYIIDVNLPGEDGFSLARRIRLSQPEVGIVIISARAALDERILGYEAGANIYLPKPLSLQELQAVVATFSRRACALAPGQVAPALVLDPLRLRLIGPVGEVRLTLPEVVLLAAFARAHQYTLEHWQVARHLGDGREITKDNLEVKLGRLRKKMMACGVDAPALQVLRGHGYKLCSRLGVRDA